MFICRNIEGVHAEHLKCWRGTCWAFEMLKGYILICWNAKGVHGQKQRGEFPRWQAKCKNRSPTELIFRC